MGLEVPVAFLLICAAMIAAVVWGTCVFVSSFFAKSEADPKLCSRCKREELLSRWTTVHKRFHEGATSCTPCLNPQCRHSCKAHEQLAGSYDRRFMCHEPGCSCTKFERIVHGTVRGNGALVLPPGVRVFKRGEIAKVTIPPPRIRGYDAKAHAEFY